MSIRIALAGNPNTGKTTLFNLLTGSNQYVGNWPGVTVEKKEGKLKKHKDIIITDLPGIYSLSPYTLEEVVARDYLINEKPNAIINIVDGTNLERNLYLTTQLTELGIPVVIAVNMMDVVKKTGNVLDLKNLSESVGAKVVEISALKNQGIQDLIAKALEIAQNKAKTTPKHVFDTKLEQVLSSIEDNLHGVDGDVKRWYAIKLFERDEKIKAKLSLNSSTLASIEKLIADLEREMDDDAESIITGERYNYISSIIDSCYIKRNKTKDTLSDRIDKIVTNRFLGLPIFAAVMFAVYYLSITTIGTLMTDWVNDVLFGEIIPPMLTDFLTSIGTADWLIGLVVDGIVAGVGAVLGFLPQMIVLFICLAFLESCGYMARIAFVMDRIFRKFGLSGKSFIPILVGTGCSVPGIMASRTIENDRDRKMTIITTGFMPCSAKLPIIAMIAGALFDNSPWVAPSAYFVGMAAIVVSGIILKKTKLFVGDPAPFVIELPAYHMPTFGNIFHSVSERSWGFIKKAGTVIFLASVIIWFLSNFGIVDGSFGMVEDLSQGFLANIGNSIAWIFAPLGFGNWKSAVAAVTGLVAKEVVVTNFGILYGFGEVSEAGEEIWATLRADFTALSAYTFLVFNLLCAPCFAAIGAIRREMSSGKWTWYAIGYMTGFSYLVSLIIYQIGGLILGEVHFNVFTILAVAALVFLLYLLFRPSGEKETKTALKTQSARS